MHDMMYYTSLSVYVKTLQSKWSKMLLCNSNTKILNLSFFFFFLLGFYWLILALLGHHRFWLPHILCGATFHRCWHLSNIINVSAVTGSSWTLLRISIIPSNAEQNVFTESTLSINRRCLRFRRGYLLMCNEKSECMGQTYK